MFAPKPFDLLFSSEGGCSEGLDAFRFLLSYNNHNPLGIPIWRIYPRSLALNVSQSHEKTLRQCDTEDVLAAIPGVRVKCAIFDGASTTTPNNQAGRFSWARTSFLTPNITFLLRVKWA